MADRVIATVWEDFFRLVREQPVVLEGILAAVLFAVALLAFRRIRLVAEELGRRKALSDYVRGLDEFLRGDYRDGAATLERVLERDPENVEARIALGDCHRKLGDAAEAKRHHHHVHKVFGHELARNFVSLGRDELALGNHAQAVEAFTRALELSPDERHAKAGLARAYAEAGDPIEAARQLRTLYPRGPGEELDAHERRLAARRFADAGAALLQDGDAEGAIRMYGEALAFHVSSLRARTGLLKAANALGDPERARELVERHVADLRRLAGDEELLFEPVAPRPATTAPADDTKPADATPGARLPARLEDVGGVVAAVERHTARYHCTACAALLREHADLCPACGSVGTVETMPELAELYTRPVADFRETIDEVEENASFVQGLAHRASLGDDEALDRLVGKGPSALYEVFSALPALEARRCLGSRLAAMGAPAALEVEQCHAARAGGGLVPGVKPHDEFAAAFYLALGDDDLEQRLATLGNVRDAAVAGVLADPRVAEAVRDRAMRCLQARAESALAPLVEAVAASGDAGGLDRAAALVREWGDEAVARLEKRYFEGSLLGRIFRGRTGTRRRACADLLARSGLPAAQAVLSRAAAREKDAALRAHYVAALERCGKKGPA